NQKHDEASGLVSDDQINLGTSTPQRAYSPSRITDFGPVFSKSRQNAKLPPTRIVLVLGLLCPLL
ncbi:MAG: hypothetical protein AAF745_12450, partial [Planctomycetota bacterium]